MRESTVLQTRTVKDNYSNLTGAGGWFTGKLVKHSYSTLESRPRCKKGRTKIVDVIDDSSRGSTIGHAPCINRLPGLWR
jgi:hypothetical protein